MIEIETKEDTPEDEVRRAEHLVYVSLKYTRTKDVMKNAVKRMIAAFELSIRNYLKKNKKIKEVPSTVQERADVAKSLLGAKSRKYLALYTTLKKIEKANCRGIEEFRKNVTLITETPRPIRVKTKDLEEFLEITREFVHLLRSEK